MQNYHLGRGSALVELSKLPSNMLFLNNRVQITSLSKMEVSESSDTEIKSAAPDLGSKLEPVVIN